MFHLLGEPGRAGAGNAMYHTWWQSVCCRWASCLEHPTRARPGRALSLAGLKQAGPENFRQKTGQYGPKNQQAKQGHDFKWAMIFRPCRGTNTVIVSVGIDHGLEFLVLALRVETLVVYIMA